MNEVELTIDIRCYSLFSAGKDLSSSTNPSYRVFVDTDLITERTFIWDKNSTIIREHLFVNLEPGEHHVYVKVAPTHEFSVGRFSVQNVKINKQPAKLVSATTSWNVFIVD